MPDPALSERIENFRKMAEADPDNELGHFSLGRAYLDAGEHAQAAGAFERVIELNAQMSRAYELLATALLKQESAEKRALAVKALNSGITIAHARGDVMPKNAMLKALNDLGEPVPQFEGAQAQQEVGSGQVLCHRCGKVAAKLPSAPFSAPLGQEIFAKICAPCWREWIGMGTKVINELRLPLSDPQAQKVYDTHMREFLNL